MRNQRMTLMDQLLSGIRFLDIRARLYQGDFAIHHDLVYLKKNFDDVLRETTDFLRAHPSETVYMRLKQEYSTESDAAFTSRFEELVVLFFVFLTAVAAYALKRTLSDRRMLTFFVVFTMLFSEDTIPYYSKS